MAYHDVLLEYEGDYASITMNRPERRNSLTLRHLEELIDAFETVGASDARGVILASAGPVFCSGHDIDEMYGEALPFMRRLLRTCSDLMLTMQRIPQPVVAQVQGAAIAAGCQLVGSADLAVAAQSARFQTPGSRGGWFCTTPGVAVGRAMSRKQALEMLITGESIDAETALAWGLVNRVAADEELEAETARLLGKATRGSATSIGIGKRAFYEQIDMAIEGAYAHASEVMASSSQTPDVQERMLAFLEKREPRLR